METKENKKEYIRKQIIDASHIYRDNLAGKTFLYVFGDEYFEVVFQTDRFMHLTGVNSNLKAQDFYNKAKASKLTTKQFHFDANHSYYGAKRKILCLLSLPVITNSLVCVVKELKTLTFTYKIGVTNLDFTIGLTENIDFAGHKINDKFLPRTLRVKDKAVENSNDAQFVDFILSKNAMSRKYDTIEYMQEGKNFPSELKKLTAENLLK